MFERVRVGFFSILRCLGRIEIFERARVGLFSILRCLGRNAIFERARVGLFTILRCLGRNEIFERVRVGFFSILRCLGRALGRVHFNMCCFLIIYYCILFKYITRFRNSNCVMFEVKSLKSHDI